LLSFRLFWEIFLAKVCRTFPRELLYEAPPTPPGGGTTLYRVYWRGTLITREEVLLSALTCLVPNDVMMRFGELTVSSRARSAAEVRYGTTPNWLTDWGRRGTCPEVEAVDPEVEAVDPEVVAVDPEVEAVDPEPVGSSEGSNW
jgi:hypothetical protein